METLYKLQEDYGCVLHTFVPKESSEVLRTMKQHDLLSWHMSLMHWSMGVSQGSVYGFLSSILEVQYKICHKGYIRRVSLNSLVAAPLFNGKLQHIEIGL